MEVTIEIQSSIDSLRQLAERILIDSRKIKAAAKLVKNGTGNTGNNKAEGGKNSANSKGI